MTIPEELRIALYPLGLISTFAFTLRFIIQWIQSEKAHQSTVTPHFWWISLFGNGSLLIHSLIQGQFFICLIQGANGVISWRNLNLMGKKENRWKLSFVFFLFTVVIFSTTSLFWLLSNGVWARIPVHILQTEKILSSTLLNGVGFLGIALFNSRFWIQWIFAEKSHTSKLESSFWQLSLLGALLSTLYFALIGDYINLIGPLFGIIPYFRNLILIRKLNDS